MKSIHEHIEVDVRPGGRVPRRFRWERRTYRVRRLLDYWILQTRWWGREEKRVYYRLETNRGIVEIYRAAEIIRLAGRCTASCSTGDAPDSISDAPDSAAGAPRSTFDAPCSATDGANSASNTLHSATDGTDSAAACRAAPSTPSRRSAEAPIQPVGQSAEVPRKLSRQSAEASARTAHRSPGANPLPDPRTDRPPLPIEGDTHTRERRRTDAAYRPDVRIEERARRQAAAQKASDIERGVRWVLSKILD